MDEALDDFVEVESRSDALGGLLQANQFGDPQRHGGFGGKLAAKIEFRAGSRGHGGTLLSWKSAELPG
jgi:hypothetical protein